MSATEHAKRPSATKRAPIFKPCDCIERLNKRMAEERGYVVPTHEITRWTDGRRQSRIVGFAPKLELERVGKRTSYGKPAVWAKFCPFCGKALLEPVVQAAARAA